MFRLETVERTLYGHDILNRIGLDAVDNIDGFGGIAEWGLQDEVYFSQNFENKNPKIDLESGYTFPANETLVCMKKQNMITDGGWKPSAYTRKVHW